MIYCFGDSWGEGDELKEDEKPFVHWLAKDLDESYKNFSLGGNSYPLIVTQVFDNIRNIDSDSDVSKLFKIRNIQKSDIVLIVIPPDIRWMEEIDSGFQTWIMGGQDHGKINFRYMSWLGDKTELWFRYHASLFTYSIQSALDSIGCKYLFMHNYGGEFIIDYRFKSLINTDNFLNIKSSLTTLLGGNDEYESWDLKRDGPSTDNSTKKYFETYGHPSELGHKRIAKLIKDKI